MKRHCVLVSLCALLLAGSFIVVSCMGEPDEKPSLWDLLQDGKKSLEAGDAGEAYTYFRDARSISPDNLDAKWGTVLANNLLVWRNLTGIIDLLSGVYVKNPSIEECELGCSKIAACDMFDEFRTTPANCVANCPWKLQPYMFYDVLGAPTCYDLRYSAGQWIIRTTPESCEKLCKSLDRCGLINPPLTYDVKDCIDNCPMMYVERHSQCYINDSLETCNRFDRTCFEHTVLGLQIIVQHLGDARIPETVLFTDQLLNLDFDKQYFLRFYAWSLREPAFEMNLPGRFSRPELYLSRGLGYFWEFFSRFVVSQNLDINTVTFDQYTWAGSTCKVLINDFLKSLKNTLYDPIFPNAGVLKEPYDESLEYMKGAGESLGHMFGSFARMFEALLADTDNQEGRSMHYDDTNGNFRWDDDETWTAWDLGISFTKQDVIAFKYLLEALEANFLYEEWIPVDLFKPIFTAVGYGDYAFAIDILKWLDYEELNPSYPFLHPSAEGIRPAALQIVDVLEYVKSIEDELPPALGCTD